MKWFLLLIALALPTASLAAFASFQLNSTGAAACTTDGNDGFAGAPTVSAQFPSLLASYGTKPTWCTAGVGYGVGPPAAQSFTDAVTSGTTIAAGLAAQGCTVNTGNHVITCTGSNCNNVTITGWDYTQHGGYTLQIICTGTTVANSKFMIGANARPPIFIDNSASGITVTKNIIDGNKLDANAGGAGSFLFECNGQGTTTVTYNWFKNGFNPFMFCGPSSVTNTDAVYVIKWNVFQDEGYGSSAGTHGDWIQMVATTGQNYVSFSVNYNLFVQDDPALTWAAQGLSLLTSSPNAGSATTINVLNNTFVTALPALTLRNINYDIVIDNTWVSSAINFTNNYTDPTGLLQNWLGDVGNGLGPNTTTRTVSGNKNMLNGATCLNTFTSSNCP